MSGSWKSGTAFAANAPDLVSLGSLYYEPLWVFYRGRPIDDLPGLRGMKIAIGPFESRVRALALQLLAVNDVGAASHRAAARGRERGGGCPHRGAPRCGHVRRAGQSRRRFSVSSRQPEVRLLSFARAEAYTSRFPYLTRLVLPQGTFDFAANIPSHDIVLVAPTANLLARKSLHPALAYLLMRAATEVHGAAGIFNKRDEFPASRERRTFRSAPRRAATMRLGAPFLQRYLPYWAAILVDRLWVMLLPAIAMLVPLARALPALYSWRMRSRIYRWYARLKEIELELEERDKSPRLPRHAVATGLHRKCGQPHPDASRLFGESLRFRQHIDLVRARVQARLAHAEGRGREA